VTVLFREVPTSSWRTMEFREAARRRMSSAAGTPRQTPGQDERAALQVSWETLSSRRSFGRRLTSSSRCSRGSMSRCAPMTARCRARQTSTSGCPPDLLTYRRTSGNCGWDLFQVLCR
jgi:hypothetical protein